MSLLILVFYRFWCVCYNGITRNVFMLERRKTLQPLFELALYSQTLLLWGLVQLVIFNHNYLAFLLETRITQKLKVRAWKAFSLSFSTHALIGPHSSFQPRGKRYWVRIGEYGLRKFLCPLIWALRWSSAYQSTLLLRLGGLVIRGHSSS